MRLPSHPASVYISSTSPTASPPSLSPVPRVPTDVSVHFPLPTPTNRPASPGHPSCKPSCLPATASVGLALLSHHLKSSTSLDLQPRPTFQKAHPWRALLGTSPFPPVRLGVQTSPSPAQTPYTYLQSCTSPAPSLALQPTGGSHPTVRSSLSGTGVQTELLIPKRALFPPLTLHVLSRKPPQPLSHQHPHRPPGSHSPDSRPSRISSLLSVRGTQSEPSSPSLFKLNENPEVSNPTPCKTQPAVPYLLPSTPGLCGCTVRAPPSTLPGPLSSTVPQQYRTGPCRQATCQALAAPPATKQTRATLRPGLLVLTAETSTQKHPEQTADHDTLKCSANTCHQQWQQLSGARLNAGQKNRWSFCFGHCLPE